jgi:hypothetical protein
MSKSSNDDAVEHCFSLVLLRWAASGYHSRVSTGREARREGDSH